MISLPDQLLRKLVMFPCTMFIGTHCIPMEQTLFDETSTGALCGRFSIDKGVQWDCGIIQKCKVCVVKERLKNGRCKSPHFTDWHFCILHALSSFNAVLYKQKRIYYFYVSNLEQFLATLLYPFAWNWLSSSNREILN